MWTPCTTHKKTVAKHFLAASGLRLFATRVTRLGEFSRIGRLVSLGSFFLKIMYRSITNLWPTLVHGKGYVFILTNNCWLNYILDNFFTISSGHPVRNVHLNFKFPHHKIWGMWTLHSELEATEQWPGPKVCIGRQTLNSYVFFIPLVP
jgi:hypothetical protein